MKQLKIKKITLALLAGILLANCPINLSAEQQQKRTYITTDNGRTLIYRSEKSIWNLVGAAGLATLSAACFYRAYESSNTPGNTFVTTHGSTRRYHKKANDSTIGLLGGLIFTGFGAWLTYDWYKNYTNLHVPIIILDEQGIWYEGSLFSWKEIVTIYSLTITIENGIYSQSEHLLEIVSKQNRFKINQNDIAITTDALQDLMQKYLNEQLFT
jgi:hypothetical protein